jgi:peptidoglycan/LPS O-acetylase OafA/YrhL
MSASQSQRVYSLDFLRGVASFAVAWFHMCTFHYPTADGYYYQLLRSTGAYGWLGVEVFFVISGFVIPYSLERAHYLIHFYPQFLLKRIVRLDPPYLISIVVLILLAFAYSAYSEKPILVEGAPLGWARVLLHLGYLNTFFDNPWLNPSFWTLAIEFQYYLMMGLAFPFFNSAKRAIRLGAIAIFAAGSFFSGHGMLPGSVPYSRFIFYFSFLFLMGIVTFQRYVHRIGTKEYVLLMIIISSGALLTLGVPSLMAGLFAVAAINFYKRRNAITNFFGKISYSLYLLHWPIGHLTLSIMGSRVLNATSDTARTAMIFVAMSTCIAASYLLYAFVERPAQRWSTRIKYRGRSRVSRDEVGDFAPVTSNEPI